MLVSFLQPSDDFRKENRSRNGEVKLPARETEDGNKSHLWGFWNSCSHSSLPVVENPDSKIPEY